MDEVEFLGRFKYHFIKMEVIPDFYFTLFMLTFYDYVYVNRNN